MICDVIVAASVYAAMIEVLILSTSQNVITMFTILMIFIVTLSISQINLKIKHIHYIEVILYDDEEVA